MSVYVYFCRISGRKNGIAVSDQKSTGKGGKCQADAEIRPVKGPADVRGYDPGPTLVLPGLGRGCPPVFRPGGWGCVPATFGPRWSTVSYDSASTCV